MNEDTLNFNEPIADVGVTLKDIWFTEDDETTTNEEVSTIEDPTEDTEVKDAEPAKPVSLADIKFDDEEEEEVDEEGNPVTTDQPTGDKYYTLVDGIRSLLVNKLSRLGVDHEQYNLGDMDEESLSNFSDELDDYILEKRYESAKQVNPNVNKLLTFIENEGDPKALVKLFKEQEDLQAIDGSTEEGKIKKIESYYKNVLNWDSEKASKKVDRLKASNMLEDEYADIEDEYSKHLEDKQNSLIETQKAEAQKKARVLQTRKDAFMAKLTASNLPKQVKDSLFNTAFNEGVIKGTTNKISILDYKIQAMQADPEKYLKLVQFIDNPELYDKIVSQNIQNIKTETNLKKAFVEVTPRKASTIQEKLRKKEENKSPFDFNL